MLAGDGRWRGPLPLQRWRWWRWSRRWSA